MSDDWKIPGGGASFPFDYHGDYVALSVTEFEPNLQQTDRDGKVKAFASGQPMTMHRVGGRVVASSNPAHPVGSECSIYLKNGAKLAGTDDKGAYGCTQAVVLKALKDATGDNAFKPGGEITLQYVMDGPAKDRGSTPPKWYRAWYKAPAMAAVPGAGPTQAASPVPVAVAAPPTTAASPATPSAMATASAGTPDALTPEQEAAVAAALAETQAPAWDADPRVAGLRAKGLADDVIRKVLSL